MNRVLLNFVTLKNILVILIIFITMPFAMYNVENIIQGLLCSHYTTLIINNVYITFAFKRINQLIDMKNLLIPRLGEKRFIKFNCSLAIVSVMIFSLLLYCFNLAFFGFAPEGYGSLLYPFMLINSLVYVFEEIILLQQLKGKKNHVYYFLAIMVNFYFHYVIVMPIMSDIFI